MNANIGASPRRGTSARTRRLLLLLAAIAIAPVLLSYLAYYAMPRDARVNYGTLLATRTLAPIVVTTATHRKWSLNASASSSENVALVPTSRAST